MPAAVAACRVCLAMDVRLLTIAGSLQLVYERITDNTLHTTDGRPVAACYICYAQLYKCRKLIRTSRLAENALNDILHRQSEITETSISLVDRKALGLCGSLGYWAIHDDGEVPAHQIKSDDGIEIKTEPELDIKTEIANEDSDGSVPGSPLQPTADVCDTECASDEDPGLSQPCDEKVATTEQRELREVVAPAQKSEAGTRRPAEGSTTNRKLKSQQESTTLTAQGPHHTCDVCQRQFKYRSKLMAHYRTHTGDKPFQCNDCDRRFTHKYILKQHLRTHTGEKPFQCDVCHKTFISQYNLTIHLRTHSGKPFKCDVCDQKFIAKRNLKQHLKIHTGEKPFQCNVCGNRYGYKSVLVQHLRTHTGEKPIKCDVCGQRFNQRPHLLQHFRTHTGVKPFQCGVCHKKFFTNQSLTRHSVTHTGEKQFQCDVCDHRASRKTHLLRHLRTHTGEKPFQCDVCHRAFCDKRSLVPHLRTHTDKKPL